MRHERAERTRQRVLRAAAAEFAAHGCAGTSLSRICARAGVTLGALTFHFASKAALADAVYARGCDATRAVALRCAQRSPLPLQGVVDISHGILRVLRNDAAARAARRFDDENAASPRAWRSAWLPLVLCQAERAGREGQLRPPWSPEAVTGLVACLVLGLEAPLPRQADHPATGGADTGCGRLTDLWELLLPALGAPQALPRLSAGGSTP